MGIDGNGDNNGETKKDIEMLFIQDFLCKFAVEIKLPQPLIV